MGLCSAPWTVSSGILGAQDARGTAEGCPENAEDWIAPPSGWLLGSWGQCRTDQTPHQAGKGGFGMCSSAHSELLFPRVTQWFARAERTSGYSVCFGGRATSGRCALPRSHPCTLAAPIRADGAVSTSGRCTLPGTRHIVQIDINCSLPGTGPWCHVKLAFQDTFRTEVRKASGPSGRCPASPWPSTSRAGNATCLPARLRALGNARKVAMPTSQRCALLGTRHLAREQHS